MTSDQLKRELGCAIEAAQAAGALMRRNLAEPKRIASEIQHDIKLELDVRCQKLIEKTLLRRFPKTAILGEEGVRGDQASPERWVVDPIDGTVNFAYGIPHACVSIALQRRLSKFQAPSAKLQMARGIRDDDAAFETLAGVVYDPFCNELWTAVRGGPARLNGKIIRVSSRRRLDRALVSLGFAKSRRSLHWTLSRMDRLIPRVRKIRVLGAAALDIAYVASGRLDAYVETGLRLWDIAAGGLIVECAGGNFSRWQLPGEHAYAVLVNNGLLRRRLQALCGFGKATPIQRRAAE